MSDQDPFPAAPVRGTTRIIGVFGYPVAHSASPPMHNAAFAALGLDFAYVPFAVAPDLLADALQGVRALDMAGANITVPLKELAASLMDELTPRARLLGAVNTVVNRNKHLTGDSTDGPGFLAALADAGKEAGPNLRAVVLGAGGSARAVVYALAHAGAHVLIANRSRPRADALKAHLVPHVSGTVTVCEAWSETAIGAALQTADVLINTTSVGMSPRDGEMPPVPASALRPGLLVCDLIYKPAQTRLLALAHQNGCSTQNGIEMLVQQGGLAFTQWTSTAPPLDVMRRAVQTAVYGETNLSS